MGKSSFEASRFNGFRFDPSDLVVIGVDTEDGSEHPLWDERINLPLDETMVLSFMAIGIKEPITVRKTVVNKKEVAEVVDGRRRVLHAREANRRLAKLGDPLLTVPALVERGSEGHMSHVAIALNEIRKQDDILVKAEKAARMINRGGNVEDVATAFGVSKTAVNNWLKIVELSAPVKKAVADGRISASAASQLHGLSREEQLEELEKALQNGHATTQKVKSAAKKAKSGAEGVVAPGKRLIGKVLKLDRKTNVLPDDFARGVAWAIGELSPASVKGLTALITEAQAKKEKKPKTEAAE
jgi:ParB family transcriptional regulator, chromosome partitioning protein